MDGPGTANVKVNAGNQGVPLPDGGGLSPQSPYWYFFEFCDPQMTFNVFYVLLNLTHWYKQNVIFLQC